MIFKDRVGLGWRRELAAGIISRLNEIDVLEIIADDYFHVPKREVEALRTLSGQIPLVLHGVGMGLASSLPVQTNSLDHMRRLVDILQPEFWSEHLAFVRAGQIEIGHLAYPPRSKETIDGACRNIELANKVVGSLPTLENIATLIDPPGCAYSETEWIGQILNRTGCNLLLDLHNLYANSVNFSFDPKRFISELPHDKITTVHLAGGRWISGGESFSKSQDKHLKLLDDHLHSVPDIVFELLEEVSAVAKNPLTVIIERDGKYPPMNELINEIKKARISLEQGRNRALCVHGN